MRAAREAGASSLAISCRPLARERAEAYCTRDLPIRFLLIVQAVKLFHDVATRDVTKSEFLLYNVTKGKFLDDVVHIGPCDVTWMIVSVVWSKCFRP